MSITQALCTSFKREVLKAVHDFETHAFKLALYTSSASLNAGTTAYTASGEIVGTAYTAAGVELEVVGGVVNVSDTGAYVNFSDATWVDAVLTARGGLIYNDSVVGKPSVAVLDFGMDRVAAGKNFVVAFPATATATALVRLV